jgi:superfamily II DNA/RNA helicase
VKSTQQDELLRSLPSPGSWRIMPGKDLPSVFSPTFRAKIDSAAVIAEPTSTGGTYLVFSARRVDSPARAIDIEPFGLIVHSTGPSASGVYIHHGDWEGRTRRPPPGFWEKVSRSGIGGYYLTSPPWGLREGTLAQLPKGDRGAFDAIVREIRARVDSGR